MAINKINSKSIEDLQISADDLANGTVTVAKLSSTLDLSSNTITLPNTSVTSDNLSYPLTTFSSTGIDDNATSTAVTIDSSENVLVGKTSANTSTVGAELRPDGLGSFTRSGTYPIVANRTTSDGDIISLRKDGTTVGSISALGSRLGIGSGDTGLFFNLNSNSIIPYNPTENATKDNLHNLGQSDKRFIDLYLGGGLYVGGTASANHLDDYEEGTWTPTTNIGYATINSAIYVKIGRLVFAHMNVVTNAGPGDVAQATAVSGLPFSAKSSADQISNSNIIEGLNQDVYAQIGGTDFSQRDRADNVIVTRGEYGNKTHKCTIVYYTDD